MQYIFVILGTYWSTLGIFVSGTLHFIKNWFNLLWVASEIPAWQSILWIFQVFFTRWCGIMASKKSFLRMMIIVPSAVASAASASSRGRRRLKGPSASSGMWSSTTTILLLYLLVLEVAAFQQNFGKIGKSQLLTRLRGHSQTTLTDFCHFLTRFPLGWQFHIMKFIKKRWYFIAPHPCWRTVTPTA